MTDKAAREATPAAVQATRARRAAEALLAAWLSFFARASIRSLVTPFCWALGGELLGFKSLVYEIIFRYTTYLPLSKKL